MLPFTSRGIRSLAVIGPQAEQLAAGGGSSWITPPYRVTPLDGIRALAGTRIRLTFEPGCGNLSDMPVVPQAQLVPGSGRGRGVRVTYFDGPGCSGAPVSRCIEPDISRWTWMEKPHPAVQDGRSWSARFECHYIAGATGLQRIQLDAIGDARLWIDGTQALHVPMPEPLHQSSLFQKRWVDRELVKGRRYRIRIDFTRVIGTDDGTLVKFQVGSSPASGQEASSIAAAAAAARACDAAVVMVGLPERFDGEESDRTSLALPGRQAELVQAVLAANPRTAVVVQCGSPVELPFLAQAPAVLLAWYPGMEGGAAIARALFGLVNPSGKLPMTFPQRLEDCPASSHYPGIREARYGEGIFVGYRHYDARGIQPLLPFGHGLSYTSFTYSRLHVPARLRPGAPLQVSLELANTGPVAGAEVVQLYVGDESASLPRPVRELKAFAKVRLKPGQRRTVRFSLGQRDLSFFDPVARRWVAEAGRFSITVGSSSRDLRLQAMCELLEAASTSRRPRRR